MGTYLPTGNKSPSVTGSFKINNQISYWQNLSFYAYPVDRFRGNQRKSKMVINALRYMKYLKFLVQMLRNVRVSVILK